ncbi:hypothetical protein HYX01_04915, partial [Candidatus Woesearchaeota archaeon]|nr:hypothetical protein [Candidatus Woesearchaeota archaeon]
GVFLVSLDTKNAEGNFSLKLSAISELGKVQRKKDINVNVKNCYALSLEMNKEKDVICSGESRSYSAVIKNLGAAQNVTVKGASEWLNVENNTFELKPEEEKIFEVKANPGKGVIGSFSAEISAVNEDKKSRASDFIAIDVIPKEECYKAEVIAKDSYTVYGNDFFFVKVKNNGIKEASYKLSVDGASWVSLSPETLELNPGESGNVNLLVNPKDISLGNYGIKINLESDGAVFSKKIGIIVKKENELWKKLKLNAKLYRYYFYLLVAIAILILIFLRQIMWVKNKIKGKYRKYKIRRMRLEALKIAREKRWEGKAKNKDNLKKQKQRREVKINYRIIVWALVAALVYSISYFGLFAKIKDFFVLYSYYLIIGFAALLFIIFLMNFYKPLFKYIKGR